jgi:hypothetical protein
MARYQVREGRQLPHNGQVLEAGEVVELPRHVASDSMIRDLVEEIDEAGNPVLAPLVNDLERFRPHEQVTLLQGRLAEAKARVETLEAQIAEAEAASAHRDPVAPAQPLVVAETASEDEE